MPLSLFGFASVVVAAGSCNRSCQKRLLPTHSFAKYRSRLPGAALPALSWQMQIYLVRIPRRKGHSLHSVVLLTSTIAGPSRRIQGPHRVGPNGRDLKLRQGNRDRTTGQILASPGSFQLKHQLRTATIPLTWAEDRATAGKQPERRPRGQHRMGRHDAALFHSGLAPKR
jgi:hypothetical protein